MLTGSLMIGELTLEVSIWHHRTRQLRRNRSRSFGDRGGPSSMAGELVFTGKWCMTQADPKLTLEGLRSNSGTLQISESRAYRVRVCPLGERAPGLFEGTFT